MSNLSTLEKLKAAKGFDDLAKLLGYKPSALSYLLYVYPTASKYESFSIPKKSGGSRQINAPTERLKKLQKRLSNLLNACLLEIEKDKKSYSHGFKVGQSIATNASVHTSRRYVLNLDLEDFFPSLNFGRVRGFFFKDKNFELPEKIATAIAQIAIHENQLPQGSPCSPVVSNLVTRILDSRLAGIAKKHRCKFTRYADDITHSTNQKEFPADIATKKEDGSWELAAAIERAIVKAGFRINSKKTRVYTKPNQQTVTGLTVNKKVNTSAKYYRATRAMCHSMFNTGTFHKPVDSSLVTAENPVEKIDSIAVLEGVVNFNCFIKDFSDNREEVDRKNAPSSARKLYRKLLNFKHFAIANRPLILCEGKTDNVYLKAAIRQLPVYQRTLGKVSPDQEDNVNFFKYSKITQNVMLLGGGAGDLKGLINKYKAIINSYNYCPISAPIIIVIDNDSGANEIFSTLKQNFGIVTSHADERDFFRITHNLYLVKTPLLGHKTSCIEDFFKPSVLATIVDGKTFDPDAKIHAGTSTYSKQVFAEKVVRPNEATIDFTGFAGILDRICKVIADYKP